MQRQRALGLWREIVRVVCLHTSPLDNLWDGTDFCVEVKDPNTRRELQTYARDEFQRNRNVTDIVRAPWMYIFLIMDAKVL